jgi:hypothetical protein
MFCNPFSALRVGLPFGFLIGLACRPFLRKTIWRLAAFDPGFNLAGAVVTAIFKFSQG